MVLNTFGNLGRSGQSSLLDLYYVEHLDVCRGILVKKMNGLNALVQRNLVK